MKLTRPLIALALTTGLALLPLPGSAALADDGATEPVLTCFPHGRQATNYSDSWGAGRSGGRRHQGTDMLAEKGIEILAVAGGTITRMRGDGGLSGYGIVIDHGGWESHYLHLNNDTPGTDDGNGGPENAFAPGLVEGMEVAAGDVIGYVGDSGNAEGTSPHTHFELHIGGSAVNPYRYVVDVEERNTSFVETIAALATSTWHGLDTEELATARAALNTDPNRSCVPDSLFEPLQDPVSITPLNPEPAAHASPPSGQVTRSVP